MRRALLIVLDSVGIGHAPDAAEFGDAGANTVGHIREQLGSDCCLPTLDSIGLAAAEAIAKGSAPTPYDYPLPEWQATAIAEKSSGKDTTTGHWELAGAPLEEPFAVFETFPPEIIKELEKATGTSFIGNYAQSGTTILEELGKAHVETGKPILYTSADSVLQIAAHEEVIPLETLYEICKNARLVADNHRIGRVIARPFVTDTNGKFTRTSNRRDFSFVPPETVLDRLTTRGIDVIGVGKISDIFAEKGITTSHPTKSDAAGMAKIDQLWQRPETEKDHLIFSNLVDFDMLYGHRRDIAGYGAALEAFDTWLASFLPKIRPDDLIMITADHGNDPSWTGSDHTREQVPLLIHGADTPTKRDSFAAVADLIESYFSEE